MPILHLIWAAIIYTVPWVLQYVLRAIGFGVVAYVGISFGLDQAESYIFTQFEGLGSDLYAILAMAGFPLGIKMLFTAYAVMIAVKSVGPKKYHPVWRKPGDPWEA